MTRLFLRTLPLILTSLLFGCSSHAYYNEAMAYVAVAEQTLDESGICKGQKSCSVKSLVKFEAGGWQLGPFSGGGVFINVYEISDPAVAKQLISRFNDQYKALPDVPITLHVYSSAHGQPEKLLAKAKHG